MTRFEEQLKQALARREPGADFTASVLARVRANGTQRPKRRWEWRWFRAPRAWALAGVAAALLVSSGSAVYEQHERVVRGEAAKEKLMTAVRLAGVKLRRVHRQVIEVEAEVNQ
jgi:hypothetical protein